VPLLGVCLGHQCIGEAYGATVAGAGEIKHGKMSQITHDGRGVFEGLPNPFAAVRYHSLAIVPETLPHELEVSARSESGVIMGVRHREIALEGVQFHPESILTKPGKQLLANFLKMQTEVKAAAR
jgi:anthranilate synthase/aminodeoxychorismate synthase-like glutamine amidotransferase